MLYHALIFVGAYFLLLGIANRSVASEELGASLVGVGIVTEFAVLGWSAGLTRKAAGALPPPALPVHVGEEVVAPAARRQCIRCGHRGVGTTVACPVCGGMTVKSPFPPE